MSNAQDQYIDGLVDDMLRTVDCHQAMRLSADMERLWKTKPHGVVMIALTTTMVELAGQSPEQPLVLAMAVRLMHRLVTTRLPSMPMH